MNMNEVTMKLGQFMYVELKKSLERLGITEDKVISDLVKDVADAATLIALKNHGSPPEADTKLQFN